MTRGKSFTRVYAKPRLRVERVSRGYSLDEFSKLIDYSYAGYGKIELRRNGLRPKGINKILTALGMEFDDLFEFIELDESGE